MISTWHILASGFKQTLANQTGIELAYREIRSLALPSVEVDLRLWNEDWAAYADYVWRNSAPWAEIYLDGMYSWGGGWGAMQFCKALRKIQLKYEAECKKNKKPITKRVAIKHLLLCDAVYRTGWTPDWFHLNPKSLLPHPKIVVPENVFEVSWVYQTQDRRLRGHRVVAKDPRKTKVNPGIELDAIHGTIDEHPKFQELALRVAGIPF